LPGSASARSIAAIKPFKPEELSARIRASLAAKHLIEQNCTTDRLTGLWNEKYLAERRYGARVGRRFRCASILHSARRGRPAHHQRELGIPRAMRFSARSGHLSRRCRPEDSACRYEGGKFAIVMPGLSRAEAGGIASGCASRSSNISPRQLSRGKSDVQFLASGYRCHRRISLLERAEMTSFGQRSTAATASQSPPIAKGAGGCLVIGHQREPAIPPRHNSRIVLE